MRQKLPLPPSEFKGFKKGFFNNDAAKKPKAVTEISGTKVNDNTRRTDELETIAPKNATGENTSRFVFDEVQQAMRKKLAASTKDWLTPAFLERIESHPLLSRAFADAQFQAVAQELMRNPADAFARCAQERPQYIVALREFCGLLGAQFESMATEGPTEAGAKSAALASTEGLAPHERDIVRRVQTDAELQVSGVAQAEFLICLCWAVSEQRILRDPAVQSFLVSVKNNPPELQRCVHFSCVSTTAANKNAKTQRRLLRETDDDMRAKIRRLMDAGILSIARA
ncbi:hypothetical protein HDU83_000982 [Entophlyctis luteolus]|nr:hypothetical protein HDU83_000982 [Entophlyctis luteolus]